jgi:hypothetical protein
LIQDEAVPTLISPDGRWWWDGRHWRSRLVEGKLDLFWFATTPDWFTRIFVVGLIGLIPIVGAINLYGWTLTAMEMVRSGWKELPPAGFQYLERGVNPFVAGFVYGIVFSALVAVLVVLDVLLAISGHDQAALAIVVGVSIGVLVLAAWAVYLYMFAALLVASDRLGLAKALNPRRLFALARANHAASLRVALIYAAIGISLAVIIFPVALLIPFGGLLVGLVLPAVYAMLVPSLAAVEIEPSPATAPA